MKPSTATLLVAQAVALGLLLANLIIPGSAVFLESYGSARLPFVYLLVAAAGTAVSALVNRLQSRFGLYQLAIGTTAGVAAVAALCWVLVAQADQRWAGYLVLVLFAVQLQLGFVFIGAQAGQSFDVQQIKRVFPRIVGGFVFGFMVGGFLAGPLLTVVDRAEHLLAIGAAMALSLAGLMALTGRSVGIASESGAEHGDDGQDRAGTDQPNPDEANEATKSEQGPSIRALLAIPLVGAVFAYQVLSAMGTQLVDYLVYDRAAARYEGAEQLATFMGNFTAVLNLADLLILVLVGGLLMARYGLRFGVGANPVIVAVLIFAAVVISAVAGTDSTALFVLVGVARVADLTMADVATRTSVNATFQVLPPQQRLAAQVGVEGAGVPLALGLTAALILIINAVWESPVIPIIVATAVVCVLWCALSLLVYRRYRDATVVAARRRMLDDVQVDLSEPATRQTLLDLARSGTARDVGVAVDLLAAEPSNPDGERDGDDGGVGPLLVELSDTHDLAVKHAILDHLIHHHPIKALEVAIECVASFERRLKVDGLRALGHLGGAEADEHLTAATDHDDHHVRSVALGALIASEPSATTGDAGQQADQLLALLSDDDRAVRTAAAGAVGAMPDPFQAAIFARLAPRATGPAIEEFLRGCSGTSGPETCTAVADWLHDADPKPAARAVRFLLSNQWRAEPGHHAIEAVIDAQLTRAATAGSWLQRLTDPNTDSSDRGSPGGDGQVERYRSLERVGRALADERDGAQRHLIEALGLIYDRRLLERVGHLWSDRVTGDHAMAREALDLTLAPHHRTPVLEALADIDINIDIDIDIAPPVDDTGPPAVDTADGGPRPGRHYSLVVAAELAADSVWAMESDWLQATAVAAVLEHRDNQPPPVQPLGPISAELLPATAT